MFRPAVALAAVSLLALAAYNNQADPSKDTRPWQDVMAADGLAAADAALSARETNAENGFALGSVRFLRAMEHIMQVRYANYEGSLTIIPGMRTELPENPDGKFDPAFFVNAMRFRKAMCSPWSFLRVIQEFTPRTNQPTATSAENSKDGAQTLFPLGSGHLILEACRKHEFTTAIEKTIRRSEKLSMSKQT